MYDYEKIKEKLTTKYVGQTFIQFQHLSSIQTKSKNISDNCPNGMLVLAETQDDIRLKNNKIWYCQNSENLFLGIIFKNSSKIDYSSQMLQIANAAVCESLLKIDSAVNCHIKWPNDIYINDKKVGSAFLEKVEKKDNDSLILSIYINIYNNEVNKIKEASVAEKKTIIEENAIIEEMPAEETDVKSTCLYSAYSYKVDRELLLSNILNRIEIYYDELLNSKSIKSALSIFINHNCILGKNIGVNKINKKTVRIVKAVDINNKGEIIILDKNNTKDVLRCYKDTIKWWIDEQNFKN